MSTVATIAAVVFLIFAAGSLAYGGWLIHCIRTGRSSGSFRIDFALACTPFPTASAVIGTILGVASYLCLAAVSASFIA